MAALLAACLLLVPATGRAEARQRQPGAAPDHLLLPVNDTPSILVLPPGARPAPGYPSPSWGYRPPPGYAYRPGWGYPQPGYGYRPPPPGWGYRPPPGYGYRPPPPGYGYRPPAPGWGYRPPPPGYGYRPPSGYRPGQPVIILPGPPTPPVGTHQTWPRYR